MPRYLVGFGLLAALSCGAGHNREYHKPDAVTIDGLVSDLSDRDTSMVTVDGMGSKASDAVTSDGAVPDLSDTDRLKRSYDGPDPSKFPWGTLIREIDEAPTNLATTIEGVGRYVTVGGNDFIRTVGVFRCAVVSMAGETDVGTRIYGSAHIDIDRPSEDYASLLREQTDALREDILAAGAIENSLKSGLLGGSRFLCSLSQQAVLSMHDELNIVEVAVNLFGDGTEDGIIDVFHGPETIYFWKRHPRTYPDGGCD